MKGQVIEAFGLVRPVLTIVGAGCSVGAYPAVSWTPATLLMCLREQPERLSRPEQDTDV